MTPDQENGFSRINLVLLDIIILGLIGNLLLILRGLFQ